MAWETGRRISVQISLDQKGPFRFFFNILEWTQVFPKKKLVNGVHVEISWIFLKIAMLLHETGEFPQVPIEVPQNGGL